MPMNRNKVSAAHNPVISTEGAKRRSGETPVFGNPSRPALSRSKPYNTSSMRFLIALLAIAGLIDSVLALRIHMQDPNAAPPCAVTATWDCGTVNHSRFAVFPPESFDEAPGSHHFHIPVATLGIIGYALIAAAALADKLWLTLQLTEIGFGFALFLTYMEAYILQKWCIYCVWSQIIVAVILLCTIVALVLKHRRTRTPAPTAVTVS